MATPDPTEVAPWYLRNINQALQLDETTGNVFVRTGTGPFLLQVIAEVVNGQYNNSLNVPLIAPATTDIDFRIVADGNGTQATCFWQMILVAN